MKHTLRSFRLVCEPTQIQDVENLLRSEGFDFTAEPFFDLARSLTHEPFPLGSSIAAKFGYIYIQDKSSMLPPLLLAPKPGDVVLDLCASPGSKTGILSRLVGHQGRVLGNEPNAERLATLRANLRHLGCANVVTTRYAGQELPLPEGVWPLILLDAPCSGWGTVEKNPKAAQMWAGDKTQPLENLQRELLVKAAKLLAPGGKLLYSTCTTNTRENEEQIRFAMEELELISIPLPEPQGFSFAPSLPGCLLVDGSLSDAQGFFLGCLSKNGEPVAAPRQQPDLPGELLDLTTFTQQTGMCASLPGKILSVSGKLFYTPDQALQLLPHELRWQGFAVGKSSKDVLQADPTLRIFVTPEPEDDALILTETAEIRSLLSGQSIAYQGKARKRPFYYRSLPLGFLTVKGNRCLWSDR